MFTSVYLGSPLSIPVLLFLGSMCSSVYIHNNDYDEEDDSSDSCFINMCMTYKAQVLSDLVLITSLYIQFTDEPSEILRG
jgi:hypothetical protein